MSDESVFKLLILFITLTVLLSSIVIRGRRKSPVQTLEDRFADALNLWLQQQVCMQCDTTIDQLDKRAINRISGAALKSVRPLRENHQIQVQLPKITRNHRNEWVNFSIDVSIHDVHHLVK